MRALLKAQVHQGERLQRVDEAPARAHRALGDAGQLAELLGEERNYFIGLPKRAVTQYNCRRDVIRSHRSDARRKPNIFFKSGQLVKIKEELLIAGVDSENPRD